MQLRLYVDASFSPTSKHGTYAYLAKGFKKDLMGWDQLTPSPNNSTHAELMGINYAVLNIVERNDVSRIDIVIYTDSKNAINYATGKRIARNNRIQLMILAFNNNINNFNSYELRHVKGHQGIEEQSEEAKANRYCHRKAIKHLRYIKKGVY